MWADRHRVCPPVSVLGPSDGRLQPCLRLLPLQLLLLLLQVLLLIPLLLLLLQVM